MDMPVMHGFFSVIKDVERLAHPQHFLDVLCACTQRTQKQICSRLSL